MLLATNFELSYICEERIASEYVNTLLLRALIWTVLQSDFEMWGKRKQKQKKLER